MTMVNTIFFYFQSCEKTIAYLFPQTYFLFYIPWITLLYKMENMLEGKYFFEKNLPIIFLSSNKMSLRGHIFFYFFQLCFLPYKKV